MEDPERLAHALVPHLSCRDAVRLMAAVPEASGAVAARKDVATLADFRGPRLLGMFKAFDRLCAAAFPGVFPPVFDHPAAADVDDLRRVLQNAGIFHALQVHASSRGARGIAMQGRAAVRLGGKTAHVVVDVATICNEIIRSVRVETGSALCGAVQKTGGGERGEWQLYGNDGVPLAFHEMCVSAFGTEKMRDVLIPGCNAVTRLPYFVSDAAVDYTTLLTV